MSIVSLLSRSVTTLRDNPAIALPLLVSGLLVALLALALFGSMVPTMAMMGTGGPEMAGMALWRGVVLLVVGGVLSLLAHGMTVLMAGDALESGSTSLKGAWNRSLARIVPLLIAAASVAALATVGTLLLIIPGIIISFFLMFTFVALMLDDLGAFQAIGASLRVVRDNFAVVFVLFLVMVALGVLAGVVSTVLALIPAVGGLLGALVNAAYVTYLTIFVVTAYRDITSLEEGTPDVEV